MGNAVGTYYEAAVVIVALVFVGQVLELRARERTGDAIRALLDLAPKTARRILPDGTEYDAPLENIMAGDRLQVRPGDAVPVDGVVVEGHSALDESMLTGESMPVEKSAGDAVTGATINKNGSLVIEAGKVGADTVLSQIVAMVSNARRSRAPIQGLADRVAGGLRANRGGPSHNRLHRLAGLRAAARADLCRRLGRVRPDHRLPLRAWACHPDLDHHGGRARGAGRRSDQGRRGARTDGQRR